MILALLLLLPLTLRAEDDPKPMNDVLTQSNCVPHFENGKAAGYTCLGDKSGATVGKDGKKFELKSSLKVEKTHQTKKNKKVEKPAGH
jgi:hypothetical protein